MQYNNGLIERSLMSGTVAGIATSAAAALAGKREQASYSAPVNATSHIIWGDKAALQDTPSLKYTATGVLLNHSAAIMWAAVYEKWFAPNAAQRTASPLQPLIGTVVVAAGAYITDYYLVPKRFTPGYEKRVSGKSMVAIYAALALGMAARALVERRAKTRGY